MSLMNLYFMILSVVVNVLFDFQGQQEECDIRRRGIRSWSERRLGIKILFFNEKKSHLKLEKMDSAFPNSFSLFYFDSTFCGDATIPCRKTNGARVF